MRKQQPAVPKWLIHSFVYFAIFLGVLVLLTAWSPEAIVAEWVFTLGCAVCVIMGLIFGKERR